MVSLIKCLAGPRLNYIFKSGETQGKNYVPNAIEFCGDGIIKSISWAWSFGVYTSPIAFAILYRKGVFNLESASYLIKFMGTLGIVLFASYFIRGIGRYTNPQYADFLLALQTARETMSKEDLESLNRYDFEFDAWPINFNYSQVEGDGSKPKIHLSSSSKRHSFVDHITALPCQILSYVVIHSFGRRLIYPGTVKLLQYAMEPMLREGRTKLVEENNGQRYKLLTRENNEIDCMFIDRRGVHENGKTLFIGCEGNAGFYEVGIIGSAIENSYSVIGWNHPGFGGSTGVPFPDQEANAIDAVMQFAISQLGFDVEQIVLFAWSIGGYPATWAAMNYPDVKAVILDATFDDLVPLAINKMPKSWNPLVIRTIKQYMNLNIAQQLIRYPGPILLYRRSKDEVITTVEPSQLASNRGNNLLIKLLQYRYPNLLTETTYQHIIDWVSGESEHHASLLSLHNVEDELCESLLRSYIIENSNSFPMLIGENFEEDQKIKLLLYLANRYMIDFEATHCIPLPGDMLQLPWNSTLQSHDNDE